MEASILLYYYFINN